MQKYNFDRVFLTDGSTTEPAVRARRTYRAGEVEAIRAEAFAAGEKSALVKAEQSAAKATEDLAASVEAVLNTLRAELDLIRDDSTRLAAQIARHFVSQMIEKAPEMYLERCIDECLEVLHREPQVSISIPAGASDSLKQRLAGMVRRHGLETGLNVEESAQLKGVSCRLAWKSGGAEISLEDALGRIDQIIADHIQALANNSDSQLHQASA